MKIDSSWTFNEIFKNIKAIKLRYVEVLSSFSNLDIKYENEYIRSIKKSIYSLDIVEWKKDRLWDYMNDYIPYWVLKSLYDRERNNNGKRIKKQN